MTEKVQDSISSESHREDPAESLDAVRDLLFGAAARDFDAKLSTVEEQLSSRLRDAQLTTDQAFSELREQHEVSFKVAQDQSVTDRASLLDTLSTLETKVDGLFNGLGADLSALTQRLAEADSKQRSALQQAVGDLRNDFRTQLSVLENRMAFEVESRRAESVSRTALVEVMQSAIAHIEGPVVAQSRQAKAS